MAITEYTIYTTSDGARFEDRYDAQRHEQALLDSKLGAELGLSQKATNYVRTCYSGIQLLKQHTLDEVSVWHITGEDPNPDMAGPHSNPHIAYVEGSLRKAIEYAVAQPDFYTWGGGGMITKNEPKKVIKL